MYSYLILVFTLNALPQLGALLYPASSSMSLTSSVSVPVVEYFPERRILIDWCFVMGYDLPSQLSSFYNIPIWPGKHTPKVRKREIGLQQQEMNPNHTSTHHHLYEKYEIKVNGSNRHPSDFTAGELYQGIEDFLVSYGFHETCLLRSVCELAQHPFDDRHQNILTDIFTFLLTPSLHEGFDSSEQLYRETYEDAEMRGFLGEDCAQLYANCDNDLLSLMSKVIFFNS